MKHYMQTGLDVIGLIPVIGCLKYADEAAAVLKNADELGSAVKNLDEVGDVVKGTSETVSKNVKVIGRLNDTAIAKNWLGHEVLDDPNWTLAKNDDWVNSGIKNNQDFYVASPMIEKNLVSSNPKYPGETVFAREIRMLKEAGYIQQGDNFIHPNNLK